MKIYRGSENFHLSAEGSVVTIGNFDGVHIAHQSLISHAIEQGRRLQASSVVYTFEPHPAKVLSPSTCPILIQTLEQKLHEIEKLGVEACIVEKFTHDFAQIPPETFFREILQKKLFARTIIVGHDFTFGFGRHGNDETLKKLGAAGNIDIILFEPVFLGDTLVSSSAIRKLIQNGDVELAAKLLGRNFYITGNVVRGHGIGGKLFVKTANLKTNNELIPLNGVYVTRTTLNNERTIPSITSIGDNPTISGLGFSIETHLINFDEEILNNIIKIEFITRLREQKAFESTDALAKQIASDIDTAKSFHNSLNI